MCVTVISYDNFSNLTRSFFGKTISTLWGEKGIKSLRASKSPQLGSTLTGHPRRLILISYFKIIKLYSRNSSYLIFEWPLRPTHPSFPSLLVSFTLFLTLAFVFLFCLFIISMYFRDLWKKNLSKLIILYAVFF